MTKSLVQQFPDLTAETFVLKDLFVFFREGTRNECQNRRFIRFGKRQLELFLQPSAGRIDKAGQKRRGWDRQRVRFGFTAVAGIAVDHPLDADRNADNDVFDIDVVDLNIQFIERFMDDLRQLCQAERRKITIEIDERRS